MSKSLGNIVDPLDAAKRFGPDPLRLYLTKEVPYGADGDFTWERFEEKYNADLANNLGNLVNRVASMTERYRQGRLPASAPRGSSLPGIADSAVAAYREAMDRHALHDAVAAAFRLVSATNEFVAASQPWALAKDPTGEADVDRRALRRRRSGAHRGRAAAAGDAGLGGRDPAADGRPGAARGAPAQRRRVAIGRRPPDEQRRGAVAPHRTHIRSTVITRATRRRSRDAGGNVSETPIAEPAPAPPAAPAAAAARQRPGPGSPGR